MLIVFQIIASGLKKLNNCKKFSIINFELNFNRNYLFKKINYKILLTKIRLSQTFSQIF